MTKRKSTTTAPEEPWPPTAVVVYQDGHNAPAAIVQANDDRTLDVRVDLYGLGREMLLYGVAQRRGSGNGWELA